MRINILLLIYIYIYIYIHIQTQISLSLSIYIYYASITFIIGNFQDKTYLDSQFSLKTDLTSLAFLVDFAYLGDNYINTDNLTTLHYNKTQTDNLLTCYTTNTSLQTQLNSFATISLLD